VDRLSQLTEDEFEHIEEEISRTAKGRSFLRRFRRQALGAATEEIRAMLEEFRLSWRQQSQAIEAANRINVLRQELIEMAASIERARQEIAALQPADADNNKIISATSELDAIVISTERASFEILNAAEKLMELSSRFRDGGADPELCSAMDDEVNSIFTACSFQDLTGQRTTKVVNALRYIEQRVMAMMSIWGADAGTRPAGGQIAGPVDSRPDAHLLNGPSDNGVNQDEIDRLLGGSFTPTVPCGPSEPAPPPVAKPAPPPAAKPPANDAAEEPGPAMGQGDIDSLFA